MAGSPDRRPPTPDIAYLQERGGLTPAHWGIILWRLPTILDPTTRKVEKYGEQFGLAEQDTNLHHRAFLGRRHWDRISQQDTTYQGLQVNKRFPFVHRPHVDQQLALEVLEFAQAESKSIYTLDDYFHDFFLRASREGFYCEVHPPGVSQGQDGNPDVSYDGEYLKLNGHRWELHTSYRYGTSWSLRSPEEDTIWGSTEQAISKTPSSAYTREQLNKMRRDKRWFDEMHKRDVVNHHNSILYRVLPFSDSFQKAWGWLPGKSSEIQDPATKTPEQIIAVAKTAVSSEELAGRVGTTIGWEKDIPK